jgi:hypothetical protein
LAPKRWVVHDEANRDHWGSWGKRTTFLSVADQSEVRVSDHDRERVVGQIREHFAAGRLTEDELSERVQAAYQARTSKELAEVRADLPQLPPTPAEQRAELVGRRGALQRRLLQESGGALVLFLICTVIWVAAGASGAFWPVWVALVGLIPLVRNGWRLYGPAPELDQVEQELTQREQARYDAHDRRRLGR